MIEKRHDFASYLPQFHNPKFFRKLTNKIVQILKSTDWQYDYIAFRGASGALMAPIICQKLNKRMIYSRKSESYHSKRGVEGLPIDRDEEVKYIFLDDLIHSGDTLKETKKSIEGKNTNSKLVGIFLYNNGDGLTYDLIDSTFRVPKIAINVNYRLEIKLAAGTRKRL